jgi:hypothetical protein
MNGNAQVLRMTGIEAIGDDELDAVTGGEPITLAAIATAATIVGGVAAAIQLGMWAYEAYQGWQCAAQD